MYGVGPGHPLRITQSRGTFPGSAAAHAAGAVCRHFAKLVSPGAEYPTHASRTVDTYRILTIETGKEHSHVPVFDLRRADQLGVPAPLGLPRRPARDVQ
jgi:hypothetical protein